MEHQAKPAPPAAPVAQVIGDQIADLRFLRQLHDIEAIKQFLFSEKVLVPAEQLDALDLGPLNNLKPAPNGRAPTEEEWKRLDKILAGLVPLLTPELRWKLRVKELEFFFHQLPLITLATAVVTTTYYMMYPFLIGDNRSFAWAASYWGSLVVWTISQGVLGACAYLGVTVVTARSARPTMNPDLSTLTIDISDPHILTIRIILGALFAFLIGLPLSNHGLQAIYYSAWPKETETLSDATASFSDYVYLLAPFMFGFSTSLVLSVLNRLVSAIHSLLGISKETPT